MKKMIILSVMCATLYSCGRNADPKKYADAYCKCMSEEGSPDASSKEVRDECFERVNNELGKVAKDDIPKFQEHLKETECAAAVQ